jgi:hypothetical protein
MASVTLERKVEILTDKVSKLLKAIEGIGVAQDKERWVSQAEFAALTGKNTTEKLRHFRQSHPELVKFKSFGKDSLGRNKRGDFKYNWTGYEKLYGNPILA